MKARKFRITLEATTKREEQLFPNIRDAVLYHFEECYGDKLGCARFKFSKPKVEEIR